MMWRIKCEFMYLVHMPVLVGHNDDGYVQLPQLASGLCLVSCCHEICFQQPLPMGHQQDDLEEAPRQQQQGHRPQGHLDQH